MIFKKTMFFGMLAHEDFSRKNIREKSIIFTSILPEKIGGKNEIIY